MLYLKTPEYSDTLVQHFIVLVSSEIDRVFFGAAGMVVLQLADRGFCIVAYLAGADVVGRRPVLAQRESSVLRETNPDLNNGCRKF